LGDRLINSIGTSGSFSRHDNLFANRFGVFYQGRGDSSLCTGEKIEKKLAKDSWSSPEIARVKGNFRGDTSLPEKV
jgi:hypothetical protein